MSYTVLLANFEGPLELLLRFIEREQLDITDIAISKVTNDYLAQMSQLDLEPEELNWFVEIASKLVRIKSQVLLSDKDTLDEEDEALDLTEQLKTYRIFRNMAREFAILSKNPAIPRPRLKNSTNQDLTPTNLTVDLISSAYQKCLSDVRNRQPHVQWEMIEQKIRIDQVIKKLELKLLQSGTCDMTEVINNTQNTHEAVLYFLAILELHKSGRILIIKQSTGKYEQFILRANKCLTT